MRERVHARVLGPDVAEVGGLDDDLVVEAAYLGDVGAENPRVYSFPHSRLERVDDAAVVDAALP